MTLPTTRTGSGLCQHSRSCYAGAVGARGIISAVGFIGMIVGLCEFELSESRGENGHGNQLAAISIPDSDVSYG